MVRGLIAWFLAIPGAAHRAGRPVMFAARLVSYGLVGCGLVGWKLAGPAIGEEGLWTPGQVPALAADLREAGLALEPAQLGALTDAPMAAVVSLGGCSGAFVSDTGLVVTNHHCARGSVQYNSVAGRNYLKTGYLADNLSTELPAAPGTRVYVTLSSLDVSEIILNGLEPVRSGRALFEKIEQRKKAVVAECERQRGHRCEVVSFFGGTQYRLIDQLELRDIRLVYAPSDSIGSYGGEADNWQWPRHAGDFALYRAYVSPTGEPADYNPASNVPYRPAHHLRVSASGLEAGDFVLTAGYPGQTHRYARASEVQHRFGWSYPTMTNLMTQWIGVIEQAAPEGSDARIRYASRLQALENAVGNMRRKLAAAEESGLVERRRTRDAELATWVGSRPDAAQYRQDIEAVDTITSQVAASERRDFWYEQALRPQLLGAARSLYRLAREKQKSNDAREPGYQVRDMPLFQQRLERIQRRFHPGVEKQEWKLFLRGYMDQPAASRVAAFDAAMGLGARYDEATVDAIVDRFYNETVLGDLQTRIGLMNASVAELERMNDPFLQLAATLYETDRAREDVEEALQGRMLRVRPGYMRALIAFEAARGNRAYPDGNNTLRLSHGQVTEAAPADGLRYAPFTTLQGLVDKETGTPPFASPDALLARIRAGTIGAYASEALGSVPVNFLTDVDASFGNSGSPTLNAQGELVGLLFDGTLAAVNSDWDYDPASSRSIHVDTRYMLWVMEFVDNAGHLIEEMDIVGLVGRPAPVAAASPPQANDAPAQPEAAPPADAVRAEGEGAPAAVTVDPVEASPAER